MARPFARETLDFTQDYFERPQPLDCTGTVQRTNGVLKEPILELHEEGSDFDTVPKTALVLEQLAGYELDHWRSSSRSAGLRC